MIYYRITISNIKRYIEIPKSILTKIAKNYSYGSEIIEDVNIAIEEVCSLIRNNVDKDKHYFFDIFLLILSKSILITIKTNAELIPSNNLEFHKDMLEKLMDLFIWIKGKNKIKVFMIKDKK